MRNMKHLSDWERSADEMRVDNNNKVRKAEDEQRISPVAAGMRQSRKKEGR